MDGDLATMRLPESQQENPVFLERHAMGEVTLNVVGGAAAQGGATVPAPGPASRQGPVQPAAAPVSERPVLPVTQEAQAAIAEQDAALPQAAEMINRALAQAQRELRFSVDEDSGRTLVYVLQPETGEVVRQIPSEVVLAMAEMLERGEPLRSLGIEYRT
jgi:flagellar protein FlaG